ncbi:MAG: pyruvate dehydrogenase complex dihydrolipoamide acetyltransferase [Sphingomonadaceae bacterium]|nr:pyruvate dehydrogenase complex dihydrolipoamide acetyltransferase [Sphingomonadaceae bacterium]
MPALSPTMETGTLAKWLVKVGDAVKSGDILAEIETDKATMEVESIDEGTVVELLVTDGTEDIKVGAVIARLAGEGEAAAPVPPPSGEVAAKPTEGAGRDTAASRLAPSTAPEEAPAKAEAAPLPLAGGAGGQSAAHAPLTTDADAPPPTPPASGRGEEGRIAASPLARRLAAATGLDLAQVTGTGPHGRIVKADVDAAAKDGVRAAPLPLAGGAGGGGAINVAPPPAPPAPPASGRGEGAAVPASAIASSAATLPPPAGVPMEAIKLSNMRKTIARRLAESKATVPHFYLTVDVRLDALLKLRGDLNKSLEATGIKLSVNDLLIKALGLALVRVPDANVQFAGSELYRFSRADISVAVAIPGGLITPVITDAANKRPSVIASEMKDLAARAKDGKLKPEEYQGGTASLSNLGMFGIKQFDAVINPPQGLILAVGAGEKRPYVVDDALQIATVMSATGSFDHRAIDGAVGAQFMSAFKALVENPMGMLA